MKKIMLLLVCVLFLLSACSLQSNEPSDEQSTVLTTESVTVDPALLPDVYEDASAFIEAGQIALSAPAGATEVTQIILYDEICQMQFVYDGVFYTYRAAFASTGRTGYELTGIVEALDYLETEVSYANETVDFTFEAHLLDGGSLLLWSDGGINYSLSAYGGTFEKLCAVADEILK